MNRDCKHNGAATRIVVPNNATEVRVRAEAGRGKGPNGGKGKGGKGKKGGKEPNAPARAAP